MRFGSEFSIQCNHEGPFALFCGFTSAHCEKKNVARNRHTMIPIRADVMSWQLQAISKDIVKVAVAPKEPIGSSGQLGHEPWAIKEMFNGFVRAFVSGSPPRTVCQ